MRPKLLFAAIIVPIMAMPALAQSYPAVAVVLQQDVEVRSGPSKQLFATSKLKRGDKVLVLRECKDAPGWLEIEPPPGSFSWISGKFVKMVKDDPRHAVVDAEPGRPAPVMPGSRLEAQMPNREIYKYTSGSIVVIVDRPLSANNETWLPIKVHPSEVRYLPAEAVQPATQIASNNTTTPNWTLGPNGYSTNPLLTEADKALEKGDKLRAQQLLQEVADKATDPNQKQLALNKLQALQQGTTFQPISSQKTGTPVTTMSSPGQPASLITVDQPKWSVYGRLRTTGLKDDGQPIYALEDPRGQALAYVSTPAGKSLQTYIGRMVSVWGPTVYRPDASARLQFIVASHVASP